jgi:secondary thiamine-phosphate synthase enzyme
MIADGVRRGHIFLDISLRSACNMLPIMWRMHMKPIFIFFESVTVKMNSGPDICDITPELGRLIRKFNIENGALIATMIGSTGSLTAIEFEAGALEDLKNAIARLAPPALEYEHEKAWHDGNGHSHVQAALLGPSVALPVRNGRLRLGTWQQVVAINHDNRPRTRTVEVTITGSMG